MRLIHFSIGLLVIASQTNQIKSFKTHFSDKISYINNREDKTGQVIIGQHKNSIQTMVEHEIKFNQITHDYKKCIHNLGITQDTLQTIIKNFHNLKDDNLLSQSIKEQQNIFLIDNLSKLTTDITHHLDIYDSSSKNKLKHKNQPKTKNEFDDMTALTNQLVTVTSDLTKYKKLYEHALEEHHGTIKKIADLQLEYSTLEKKISTMYINAHTIIRDFNLVSTRLMKEWDRWYVHHFQQVLDSQLFLVKQHLICWEEICNPYIAKTITWIKKYSKPVAFQMKINLISIYENYLAGLAHEYFFIPWSYYCAPVTNQLLDIIDYFRLLLISILKKFSKSTMVYVEMMDNKQDLPFYQIIYQFCGYLHTYADDFFTFNCKHFNWLITIFLVWFILPIIGKIFYILFLFASIYMPVQVLRQYTKRE